MNLKAKLGVAIAIAAIAGGTAIYMNQFATTKAPEVPAETKEKREPGIVRLGADAPQLSSLRIESPVEQPMPAAEPVNARIAYDENVTARISSPIAGRVVALRAEVGDKVARNQPLLDLDSPDLAAADADWRKAQADEVRKKLAYDRARHLYDNEVIPRKDLESADADYRQAVAETRRTRIRMKNLNASGNEDGKFVLRAPIAGVVADKQTNPGLEVRPDLPNPLFVITDITKLWVIADVPERSLAAVKPGQPVTVETDAYPDEHFAARVDRVGLALDPATRRVQVRCVLDNPDRKLKPEMFARVYFLADASRMGVRVPNSSLLADGIYSYVFVEKAPGVFEKRRVNVALRGSENSFIDKGLSSNERVVTEGALLLSSEASSDAR